MSITASAAIVDEPGIAAEPRLALALKRAHFWRALQAARRRAKCEAAGLKILIKPDTSDFTADSIAATDPRLVESLIDLLHDAQYTNVAVGTTADSSAIWAENRSVLALTDLCGYRFTTLKGRSYDVLDLSEDLKPAPFGKGNLLADSTLSSSWLDAHFRIVFAKNKTDEADGYALCLESLLGVLPLVDKDYYYKYRTSAGEVMAELLRATPVHFALIDAIMSAHGSGGARAPKPIETNCIIAASDVQLADYVGALKMGLDPATSRTRATLTARMPMIRDYSIDGDLRIHPGWRNPHAVLMDSTRKRDSTATARRLTSPWLQVLDSTLFPLKSPLDARINATVAPYFGDVDEDPGAMATLLTANYAIAASTWLLEIYRILFDKDSLRHARVPLGLDLSKYSPEDYAAIHTELEALESLVKDLPEQAPGLKWRHVDDAVVFRYARSIPVEFDCFVSKVDVARTIQYLNDYLGGIIVPVEHDKQGRVIRQAERNIYLPQPNYIALASGKPIDVSKLETAHYEPSRHRMCWKTIQSENGSAVYDDGIVTFERSAGHTLVSIVGRQLFVLPPFWQAMSLELNPQLKAQLVTEAYKIFFDRSVANLEALLEGREIRIGRPWHEPSTPEDHEPPPVQAIERLGARAVQWSREKLERSKGPIADVIRAAGPAQRDADGFVHFKASPAQGGGSVAAPAAAGSVQQTMGVDQVLRFWNALGTAMARDAKGVPR